MIRFSYNQVALSKQAIDQELVSMDETLQRLTALAESVFASAEEALAAAAADKEVLLTELNVARDYSTVNQETLFFLEDGLGSTLAKLEAAECQRNAAAKAMEHAQTALRAAEEMPLPEEDAAEYEMLAKGRENAIKNETRAIESAQHTIAKNQKKINEITNKISDIKPKLEHCKYNLAKLGEIANAISKEIFQIERFEETIGVLSKRFENAQDDLLSRMHAQQEAIALPQAIAADALEYVTAYLETMEKIRY